MLLTIICEMVWGMDVLDTVSEVTLLVTWSAPLCLRPVTSLVRWTTSPPPASPLAIRAVLPTNAPLYVGETFELVKNFIFVIIVFMIVNLISISLFIFIVFVYVIYLRLRLFSFLLNPLLLYIIP